MLLRAGRRVQRALHRNSCTSIRANNFRFRSAGFYRITRNSKGRRCAQSACHVFSPDGILTIRAFAVHCCNRIFVGTAKLQHTPSWLHSIFYQFLVQVLTCIENGIPIRNEHLILHMILVKLGENVYTSNLENGYSKNHGLTSLATVHASLHAKPRLEKKRIAISYVLETWRVYFTFVRNPYGKLL